MTGAAVGVATAAGAAGGTMIGCGATGAAAATAPPRLIRTDSSPSEISISIMPDSSTNSISFLILRISIV